jgi:hypothetical protein
VRLPSYVESPQLSRALSPAAVQLLPAILFTSKVCLLTWPRVQPDSDRAPLSAGSSFQSPEKLFAQYSHDLESGPLTVHSAIAAKLSSMSGYNKDQEHYAYGKCSAAHMTGTPGRMPQPGRMVPIGPREDP